MGAAAGVAEVADSMVTRNPRIAKGAAWRSRRALSSARGLPSACPCGYSATKATSEAHALDAIAKDVFMGADDEKNLLIFRRDDAVA